jgi:sugar lactone lactonase YvrE
MKYKVISWLTMCALSACGGGGGNAPALGQPEQAPAQPPIVAVPAPALYPIAIDVQGMPPEAAVTFAAGTETLVVNKDGPYQFQTKHPVGSNVLISGGGGAFAACTAAAGTTVNIGHAAPAPVVFSCREAVLPATMSGVRSSDSLVMGSAQITIEHRVHRIRVTSIYGDPGFGTMGTGTPGYWVGTLSRRAQYHFSPVSSIATNGARSAVTDTCNGLLRYASEDDPPLAGFPQTQCGADAQVPAPRDGVGSEAHFDLPGPLAGFPNGGDWILAGATPNLLRRVTPEGNVSSIKLRPASPGGALPGVIRSLAIGPDKITIFLSGQGGVWKVVGGEASLFAPLPDAGELQRADNKMFVYANGTVFEINPSGKLTVFEEAVKSPVYAVRPPVPLFQLPAYAVLTAPVATDTVVPEGAQPAVNGKGEVLLVNAVDKTVFVFRPHDSSSVVGHGFTSPLTLANDAAGKVIALDKTGPSTFAIKYADHSKTLFTANGTAKGAQLAYGPLGMVAVSLPAESALRIYREDGTLLHDLSGYIPEALAFDSQGTLYFTDKASLRILKIAPTGQLTHLTHLPKTDEVEPRSMVIDRTGNIYLSGVMGVSKYAPDGTHSMAQLPWNGVLIQGLAIRGDYLYGVHDGIWVGRHKF